MKVGQQLIFDEAHHNGVYQRVCEKINIVKDIYNNPANYNAETLEHHTPLLYGNWYWRKSERQSIPRTLRE